mmetsp:Transcript_134204/g.218464  ORF Transcript_134204/g.218464 Transcript_134204/m.218464 type:complete len:100 (-) Transcript_134204:655-954(-)
MSLKIDGGVSSPPQPELGAVLCREVRPLDFSMYSAPSSAFCPNCMSLGNDLERREEPGSGVRGTVYWMNVRCTSGTPPRKDWLDSFSGEHVEDSGASGM